MYNTTTFIGDNEHYPLGTVKRAAAPKDMARKHTPVTADFAVIKPAEKKPEEKLETVTEVSSSATPAPDVDAEQAVPVAEKKVRKTRAKKAPKAPEADTTDQPGTAE